MYNLPSNLIKIVSSYLDIVSKVNLNRVLPQEKRQVTPFTKQVIYGHEKHIVVNLFRNKMDHFENQHDKTVKARLIADIFITMLNPRYKLLYIGNCTLRETVLDRARAFKNAKKTSQRDSIKIQDALNLSATARHFIKTVNLDLKNKLFQKETTLFHHCCLNRPIIII